MTKNSELSEISKSLFGQIHVKSNAIIPLLWLAIIGGALCFFSAYFLKDFSALLVCLGGICIISPILAYFYFLFINPDRLQSEEYQIKAQEIQLRQGRNSIEIVSDNLLIPNPKSSISLEDK